MKSTLNFLLLLGLATCLYFVWQPSAPAPAHRYSADDIFYLRWYVSVRTPKGSIGLLPGQEVTLSGRGEAAPGKISVNDGRDIVEIERTALTHDIDEAAALQASDASSQNSLQANIVQATQTAELQAQASQAAMADGINASSALMANQNTVGTYQTRLSQAAGRHAGDRYYEVPVVYPVAGAQPAATAVSMPRSAAAYFTPVLTAPPATAAIHLAAPPGVPHTDPAVPLRVVGVQNQ